MGVTTISVDPSVKKKLVKMKDKLGIKTWDEFFELLIVEFDRCLDIQTKVRVRKIICNDMREAKASLKVWMRLLTNKLGNVNAIQLAVEYLKPDPNNPEELIVDINKCLE